MNKIELEIESNKELSEREKIYEAYCAAAQSQEKIEEEKEK